MKNKILQSILGISALALGFTGCSSSENVLGAGDLVNVSGVVFNVDTNGTAANVKVSLYKHEEKFNAITDSAGRFSMEIPVGTKFILVTDDPDDATKDNWYRLANYEVLQPFVDKEITEYRIHSCPSIGSDFSIGAQLAAIQIGGTPIDVEKSGTVAMWNNYLANGTESDTVFPGIDSVDAAGGIISTVLYQYPETLYPMFAGPQFSPAKIAVSIDEASRDTFGAPIGFVDVVKGFAGIGPSDLDGSNCPVNYPSATASALFGNNIVDSTAVETTIIDGGPPPTIDIQALGFAKPEFKAGEKVTLTFSSNGTAPISGFPLNVDVYMEPKQINLLLFGIMDTGVTLDPLTGADPASTATLPYAGTTTGEFSVKNFSTMIGAIADRSNTLLRQVFMACD